LVLTILTIQFRNLGKIIQCLETEEVLSWWSRCRSGLTEVCRQYDGVMSVWQDEGLRVYFGVPLPSTSPEAIQHDARQAVDCAFHMLQTIRILNGAWQEKEITALEAFVNLYTGSGIGGSIQDSEISEYRIMGEVMQMSHRLDQWAWGDERLQHNDMVVAGESTVRYLGASWPATTIGDMNEWKGNGTVQIFQIQEPVSPPAYSKTLGEGL
jgi:adenylate cyclase